MSHYSVAVITDGKKNLADIMEPYNECTEDTRFKEFVDVMKEMKEQYNSGTTTMVRMTDGSLESPYEEKFLKEVSKEFYERYKSREDLDFTSNWQQGNETYYLRDYGENKKEKVPLTEVYKTLEEYVKSEGYEIDEVTGKYGYWTNPNAKWDWYQVGGRWKGMLKAKSGEHGEPSLVSPRKNVDGYYDIAQIKDIDFTPDQEQYDAAARFWEVVVEGAELKDGEKKEDFFAFYTVEYYLKHYKTKEQYAREHSEFSTFAVVTNDGKWHEKGQMGWFGCSSETGEESIEWHNSWYDTFVKDLDEDMYIIIVDCHI